MMLIRDAYAGGGGQGDSCPSCPFQGLNYFVHKCLLCALNRNLAPLPSVRAGVPDANQHLFSQNTKLIQA